MALENTHFGAERIGTMMKDCKSVFFIGIGGISMSALARISVRLGLMVAGSDRAENEETRALTGEGITVFRGHSAEHCRNYDAVVYTLAISADNPEYTAATEAGKPVFSRADYLGWLMSVYKNRIGVAGMHGKSTCTAMCASIFVAAADPTVMCGAELPFLGNSTCRVGKKQEDFIFEACEYRDSFLDFLPTVAVVLNVGMDHVDYFHDMEQIRASFRKFAELTGADGTLIYNADDAESRATFAEYTGKRVSFGIDSNADFCARNIAGNHGFFSFDFCRGGEKICTVDLKICGKHHIYNALAAATAATLCGIEGKTVAEGIASFRGAHRRMERKGTLNGADVYDDYAHHPDEIRATLAGAREMGYSRILCAFQPHTYSRTAGLFEEFGASFSDADRVYLVDIYAARETNIYGVKLPALADRIGKDPAFRGHAEYAGTIEETAQILRRDAKAGDLVLILGAGDIEKIFPLILD